MQTTKYAPVALGHDATQFDALGVLSQDIGTVEGWAKPYTGAAPAIQGSIGRWWAPKGRPLVTDVASARDTSALAEMAFAFETWAPRLA
jgi:hypothetical protein